MIKRFFSLWKAVAIIALFFVLASFLLEFFVPLDEGQRRLLEALDLVAIAILAVELIIHYVESKEKKHFFRKNWVLVASLFPFAQFLRFLKLFRVMGAAIAQWFSKAFHFLTRSTKFMRAYRVFAVWFSKRKKKRRKKS